MRAARVFSGVSFARADGKDSRRDRPARRSNSLRGCRRSRHPRGYRRPRLVSRAQGRGPMKRYLVAAFALMLALGFAAPYIDVNFMRPRIERAIQRGLGGRRVEVSAVYINLLTGPGFTVEGVTIYEDPRAGIEPFIFVGELEARVRLLPLLSRRLEFSSLRLHEGP